MTASPARRIFTNRTLNLRSIRAIGYDMDYTLVHYRIEEWERRAYERCRDKLLDLGLPVDGLRFDPEQMIRGLILDTELGNVLKVDRFGYVRRAAHGTRFLDFEAQKKAYARILVDLGDPRYVFLNTLFSLSEACLYAQLVDLLDDGRLTDLHDYDDLHRLVRRSLDETHIEGDLKAEIAADPDRFVVPDPDAPLALLDQRTAGKKIVLVTNSEWPYTRAMMSYAFDRFLPGDRTWRDLFDLVIAAARKPVFFSERVPTYEVVDESEGLLRPLVGGMVEGRAYVGGSALGVEECLGLSGSEILYVGDHLYTDVRVVQQILRWRTALIVRELEEEIDAQVSFLDDQTRLVAAMAEKEELGRRIASAKLDLLRLDADYGSRPTAGRKEIDREVTELHAAVRSLDQGIAPLASRAGSLSNENWGLLMRSGADKSHFARQVERYADIYLSRVANFVAVTPFAYLRGRAGSLPHDEVAGSPGTDPSGEG